MTFGGERIGELVRRAKGHLQAVSSSSSRAIILFFVALLFGAFVSVRWINTDTSFLSSTATAIPFVCPGNLTAAATCSSSSATASTSTRPNISSSTPACPAYFRWIHEDLRPWRSAGIGRDAVESAAAQAAFRLSVIGGRAYVEHYHGVFQTRDVFTLWGILQLLRRHPGLVPDLELMFNCEDMPVVRAADYGGSGNQTAVPPPLFRYCKDESTLDIVFPDWSFWGWPEINIRPWESLMSDMKEGNKRVKWANREPYAYWKGNPDVSRIRQELMHCDVSKDHDWNARLYSQNWVSESQRGFKASNLADQCTHRYKIYVEGRAWSVSEKYILACDSPTLMLKTGFVDFFSRGLIPGKHFWPIQNRDKCRSIKFAVDYGNSHQKEAQALGKGGSSFIQEQLRMDDVYDYMLHLLTEYAKLLTYKPSVPANAVEMCLESMACSAEGRVKTFMVESAVRSPRDSGPCSMPPRFEPGEITELLKRRKSFTDQVEKWEREGLDKH